MLIVLKVNRSHILEMRLTIPSPRLRLTVIDPMVALSVITTGVCYGPPVTYSTTITSSACYLVRHLSTSPPRHCLMKARSCPEVRFTRPHSTQAEVLSELPAFFKSVEVKASTSEHNASWNTVGFTSPSTSPLRHLISSTSPRPVFPTLPPYRIIIIVRYC
ncbi:hypothetical protein E2C01_063916 [Portunus trituberculatus]|uniref:Uncharacterized protein n=1 Tax=Portunus trituberculatus TaxID=210409 RepID=A0A5B7HID1_PORTR|nr:hypothetical protein [Portunus trituberculatus]